MINNIYLKNSEYKYYNINEKHIFINYHTGDWIKINDSAYDFYIKIDGTKSISEIFNDLSKEFALSVDIIHNLYKSTIDNLIKSSLITDSTKSINEMFDNKEELEFPKKIWIHVNDVCNLSCSFCYSNVSCENNGYKDLDYNRVVKFLQEIPQENRKEIVISGGEPFLYKYLENLTIELKHYLKFEEVTIITNGTVNHENYERILPNIDILQISLDGTSSDLNDKLRGKGSFNNTIQGIYKANNLGLSNLALKVSVTLTKDNIEDLPNYPKFAYENNIEHIHINKIVYVGKAINFYQRPTFEEYSAVYTEFLSNLKIYNTEILYQRAALEVGKEKRRPFIKATSSYDISSKLYVSGKLSSCGMGTTQISINNNGTIYPCPSLHLDEFNIGTLDDNINDVMAKGLEFNNANNVDSIDNDCYKCEYKYFCGGGCCAEALRKTDKNLIYSDCSNYEKQILDSIEKFAI